MPRALVPTTGIELEYDTFGSPDDEALLLVMGFTAQMIAWPEAFCEGLAAGGRYVIRFDNRDCGLSTKLHGQQVDLAAIMQAMLGDDPGAMPTVPYTLSDMAADSVGLLDHLGIERAHIVGASMGGMIAQTIAIEHPERVRSLVSIMSQPGDPDVGQPAPEAISVLLSPPPSERQAYIDNAANYLVWSSKKYGDVDVAKQQAARAFDRSFYPEGSSRQLAAIYASGRRSDRLRELDVPALVIHGRDDTLITPSGGIRTAELIPGAHLLLLSDMGHDLPEPLWPLIAAAIVSL